MKNIIKHWKTSLAGIMVGVFTILLWRKTITMEEWVTGVGAINTVLLLLAKDPDKS